MNTQIQKILNTKINFSIFNITDLSEDQMEMVYHNLKSKITKQDQSFERMLEKQQESEEGFYNKKTIQIVIQYLLNDNQYTTDQIKKIIKNIIIISEMTEEEEEKTQSNMNDLIVELNLGEIEEYTKYINKFTPLQYQMMKDILTREDDIEEFLDEIMKPYFQYHFNSSERFVAEDLVYDFLVKVEKDKTLLKKEKEFFMNKIIDYILTEGKILSVAFIKEDISIISNYLNILRNMNNDKLKQFIKNVNQQNKLRVIKNRHKDFRTFPEHEEHIDVSGLDKKGDIKIIEIMYVIESLALKLFFKNELKYEENKVKLIMTNLEKINIKTYFKLQNVVLGNTFVKMVRGNNKKILPGKIVKTIIYRILDKNNKLDLLKKQTITFKQEEIDVLNVQFNKMNVQPKQITLKELKNQRTNMNNLVILLKENGEDYKEQEEKLMEIDNQLKNTYLKMSSEEMLEDNIEEITDMMNVLDLTGSERAQMMNVVAQFKKTLNDQEDIFGENFNKENEKVFINRNIDKNLENLVSKFQKEFEDEEKKEKKERFNKLQNELVNTFLKSILADIDMTYRVNNMKLYEMLSEFLKHQINTKIIPRIYKTFNLGESKYNRNENVYYMLKQTIHMFVMMLNFTNKKIDYSKVYSGLEKIIRVNKKIEKVILKVNNKPAELVKERKNDVIVNYLDQEITMKKSEVKFIEDLVGKQIKITKGVHKGYVGKIYAQKTDFVLATKDLYGRNGKSVEQPRIVTLKLKYDEFKMNEEEENKKFLVENKELYTYFINNDKKLYPMTKFEMNKYYTIEEMTNFEEMYKMSIELLNDYKTNEYNSYQKIRESKKDYVSLKKEIENNKNNKRKYITLNKKLKKLHKEIRNMEKNMTLVKQTLIDCVDNLNDNYSYDKVDGLFKLREHMIKREGMKMKSKSTAQQKKEEKKMKAKAEKVLRQKATDEMVEQITDMLGNLL